MIFKNSTWFIIFLILLLIFFVEFALYYVTLLQCSWPPLIREDVDRFILPNENSQPLKILLVSDTHIGGRHRWFDRLRRQWQMQRAFQTSMFLHNPDVVFHLGDILDHGFFETDEEYEVDVRRFHEIFSVIKETTAFKLVPGNHDIGFHQRFHPYTYARYRRAFSDLEDKEGSPVILWSKAGLNFVFANSMAFHGDGCRLCSYAEHSLQLIAERLKCMSGELALENCHTLIDSSINFIMEKDSDLIQPGTYSRPILITHFPLYRFNQTVCEPKLFDSTLEKPFEPKFDCFSKSATERLLKAIRPRLIFGGHSHYECHCRHKLEDSTGNLFADEWTIPSFSYREITNPGFALLHVSTNGQAVVICQLPTEPTIVVSYLLGFIIILLFSYRSRICQRTSLRFRRRVDS